LLPLSANEPFAVDDLVLGQRQVVLNVVNAVACQPVDLLDDHVVDRLAAQEREHPL
jgi:hypothetical protein